MKISTEELRQALKEVREEELNLLLKICEDKKIEQRIETSQKRMDQKKIHRLAHKKKALGKVVKNCGGYSYRIACRCCFYICDGKSPSGNSKLGCEFR